MTADPVFALSQRVPPAHLEAEQRLLGALLANNRAMDRVADFLRPEHFADPVHRIIFQTIAKRIEAGQLVDVVTLRPEFDGNHLIDEAGGGVYLVQLLGAHVGIINAGEYGRLIYDAWLRRQVIDMGEVAVNLAFGAEPDVTAPQVLERVEAAVFAIGDSARSGRAGAVKTAADAGGLAMAQHIRACAAKGGIVGVTTGYRALDRMTGGLRPGQLVLIGARPSMGKTAIALGIAARAAAAGHRVLFVSAEMTAEDVVARAIAAQARLPIMTMLRGAVVDPGTNQFRQLVQAETDALVGAQAAVGALPLVFDDAGPFGVGAIRSRARRLKARGGLDLVVVDYIGLLKASDTASRQNRNAEISEISQGLKALAMELRIPVLALSQLSREVERRDDKTPILADLRDSGTLEQDADMVAFLYREHYYLTRSAPVRREKEKAEDFEARQDAWSQNCARAAGRGELIIAKQRQGPVGRVPLRFVDRLTWFFDDSEPDGAPAIALAAGT